MRNLSLWNVSQQNLILNSEENFVLCRGRDEDNSTDVVYVCTHNLVVRNYELNGQIKWQKDLSHVSLPRNRPLNVTYLSLQNILCVGLENGELFTLSDAGNICDLTGVFDTGLLALEWSPDQELLALVTKDYNMILLSCTFDAVCEVNLLNEEFGDKQFITVGWGKKETQFHGSEGKQARVKNEVCAEPQADSRIKITWRGDGHLFAIGFAMDGIRRFKVFDRGGHLQYTSEKQQGLEYNLSWRPSGNVIATSQRLPDKYVISFFEKNGLKHGEFNLTVNSTTHIEGIAWNADSEILSLQCYDSNTKSQKVLLYTTGNYHWYLKKTLIFNEKQKINRVMWDSDFDITHNKKLHVFLQNGYHYCYTWVWNIDHSRGKTVDDNGVVAVIDGKKLLLTGFRQTVIPPPMSAFEIKFNGAVNAVHFAPSKQNDTDIDTNTFFVLTSNDRLIFYEQTQKFPMQYKEKIVVQFPKQDFPVQFYNFCWINTDTLICIMMDSKNVYTLVEFQIEPNNLKVINTSTMPSAVTRIQPHTHDNTKAFLQLDNGDIIEYQLGGKITPLDISFNNACPRFSVLETEENIHFLGLSYKGMFYMDDVVVANSISSFFIHTHFLLITTLHHNMLCVDLSEAGIDAIKEHQRKESNKVYKRKIERGAKLVVALPCDTRTIFQMPRGNLEAIQPRPLSLKIIGEFLNELKYHEALDLMRKQRINLNLIYDHDPEKFIKNIDVFLASVKNVSWLNLFLSDLEDYDVTKTMYSSSYSDRAGKDDKGVNGSKIIKICDIMRDHLSERSDTNSKILPLMTTFVKKNTVEELEQALLIIKDLKSQESQCIKLPVSSDEALKYLLYMVDINRLFDVALGMYDFDMVLLVATKSQKDPKEYIPMLNDLNGMDENYKKFSINKHLKRFDRAVKCLVQCGPSRHDELRTFVKYHSLYKIALDLFSKEEEVFKHMSDDYALYLKLKKHFTHAGVIYERAGNIDKAIECYKEALEWDLALSLAHDWPEDEFKKLCWDMANLLKEEKRHDEALSILQQYCDDIEEIISYALECGQYKTALRLCTQHKKPDLKVVTVLPAVIEEYSKMLELIESNGNTFVKYRDRLQVVRENKTTNPVEHYDYYGHKDCDMYSDAGSTLASSSRGSTRSFRSSKNRRKHERKVASLKEGSQYEDVALVMALHTLVTSTYELRQPIKELVLVLSCLGKDSNALVLQTSLQKLLKEMKDSFKDIWTNELVIESTNAFIAAQNVPEGSSVIPQGIASLEPHIRIAPVIQEVNWTLNGLE